MKPYGSCLIRILNDVRNEKLPLLFKIVSYLRADHMLCNNTSIKQVQETNDFLPIY